MKQNLLIRPSAWKLRLLHRMTARRSPLGFLNGFSAARTPRQLWRMELTWNDPIPGRIEILRLGARGVETERIDPYDQVSVGDLARWTVVRVESLLRRWLRQDG